MAKSNRYNGYSKETLEILARMKEEEKEKMALKDWIKRKDSKLLNN